MGTKNDKLDKAQEIAEKHAGATGQVRRQIGPYTTKD